MVEIHLCMKSLLTLKCAQASVYLIKVLIHEPRQPLVLYPSLPWSAAEYYKGFLSLHEYI